MKAMLLVLALVACVAFPANAGVVVRLEKKVNLFVDPFMWDNVNYDPLTLPFDEAIRINPEIPPALKERIIQAYPDSFHVKFVWKGKEREDWMNFGDGSLEYNVLNSWRGSLLLNGIPVNPVPDIGTLRECSFATTEKVVRDGVETTTIITLRIRVWDWCTNVSGRIFTEVLEKEIAPPPSAPVEKEEKQQFPEVSRYSLYWLMEASHWNNFDDPLIRYNEGKVGLRFQWLYREWHKFRFLTDAWLASRVYTVNNGFDHANQFPLFQIQPLISLNPTKSSYLAITDALTLSGNGKDTNTFIVLGQYYFLFWHRDWFQPMIQLAGSQTDSWPRDLDGYPESRAQYREGSARFQVLRKGNLSTGWQGSWFDFAKTRLDPELRLTNELSALATGYPSPGGLFVQYKLPWLQLYVDASFMRQHIDAETYIVTETYRRWVSGSEDEWRFNLVVSRGFLWTID